MPRDKKKKNKEKYITTRNESNFYPSVEIARRLRVACVYIYIHAYNKAESLSLARYRRKQCAVSRSRRNRKESYSGLIIPAFLSLYHERTQRDNAAATQKPPCAAQRFVDVLQERERERGEKGLRRSCLISAIPFG